MRIDERISYQTIVAATNGDAAAHIVGGPAAPHCGEMRCSIKRQIMFW